MVEKIKHFDLLMKLNLPRDQFLLTGGVWLAIMGIRANKDIDIIVSSELNNQFDNYVNALDEDMRFLVKQHIDKSKKHANKIVKIAKSINVDHLIEKHYVEIDGYRFVKFSLFEKYKSPRKRQKDKDDRRGIKKFFDHKKHLLSRYVSLF